MSHLSAYDDSHGFAISFLGSADHSTLAVSGHLRCVVQSSPDASRSHDAAAVRAPQNFFDFVVLSLRCACDHIGQAFCSFPEAVSCSELADHSHGTFGRIVIEGRSFPGI